MTTNPTTVDIGTGLWGAFTHPADLHSDNLPGLCLYCADSSPQSTDTCCYNANAEQVCADVDLPTISNLPPIATATVTSAPQATESAKKDEESGLSGGAIAGITVGALVGVCLFALAGICFFRRRNPAVGTYGRNFPIKSPPSMTFTTVGPATGNYETLSGGRVARMSALETTASRDSRDVPSSPPHVMLSHPGSVMHHSSSSDYGLSDSPQTRRGNYSPQNRNLHPAPRARNTSLSSASILMDPSSPISGSDTEKMHSDFAGSPQSEQLPYFKDYYSSDDIHPGDRVSTLWAYAPRAPDEFELERGDMIKIVGIWDDG